MSGYKRKYSAFNPSSALRAYRARRTTRRTGGIPPLRFRSGRGGARPRYAGYYKSNGGYKKEVKGVDTTLVGAITTIVDSTNTNDNIWLINYAQQGTGSWNRVGRYIYNKSVKIDLELDLSVQSPGANTTTPVMGSYCRCILVWDNQPNSTSIPTFANIFGYTDQAGNESVTVLSPLRYDNMMRFRVLRDWKVEPTPGSAFNPTAPGEEAISYVNRWLCRSEQFVKLKYLMTNFSGNTGSVTNADISTGALYLVIRSAVTFSEDEGAQWSISPNSVCRLRFTD